MNSIESIGNPNDPPTDNTVIGLLKRFISGGIGIVSGELHIGSVGGEETTVTVEMIRPSNTTPYTSGDVVSNSTSTTALLIFPNIARVAGKGGYIVKARLDTDKSTWASQMRLYLFTIDNLSNIPVDNAPFTRLYAHNQQCIGYIDFVATTTEQAGSDAAGSQDITVRFKFQCAEGSRNLYGLLQDRTGGTPNSGQKFSISLSVDQN